MYVFYFFILKKMSAIDCPRCTAIGQCPLYANGAYQNIVSRWSALAVALGTLIEDESFSSVKSQAQLIKALTTKAPQEIPDVVAVIREIVEKVDDLLDQLKKMTITTEDQKRAIRDVAEAKEKFFSYVKKQITGSLTIHRPQFAITLNFWPE